MDKIRVLYDHQIFDLQKFGGISRYFAEIISNINEDEAETEIALRFSDNFHLYEKRLNKEILKKEKKNIPNRLCKKIFHSKKTLRNYFSATNEANSIQQIKTGNYDIFHPTYYDTYFLDSIGNKPYVVTVHDMIHELYLDYDPVILQKREIIKQASHIIAVSEHTKKDVMELLSIPEEKITVIYHGSPQLYDDGEEYTGKERYILFVGNRLNYKNFKFTVYAIADTLKNEDIYMLCTSQPFGYEEQKFLEGMGIADKVKYCDLQKISLKSLYRNALAFIYPSIYEGFGIPILEAWSQNCPVLTANASCFPEIGGDAVLYFNPKSKKEIENALRRIANDAELRKNLTEKGRIRNSLFTWEKSAKETLDVYKKVLYQREGTKTHL